MDSTSFCKKASLSFPVFLNLFFLFLLLFYTVSISSGQSKNANSIQGFLHLGSSSSAQNCTEVHKFPNYELKCEFVKSQSGCWSKGYLNYLGIFYCSCKNNPVVGYLVLLLWLIILFYVLGNTTSVYFCPSVENLSRVLKLSPTIAGTTLLPFGNGANDVFSSIISFTRSGDADVGFNSVLGGAFFICCVVVGIVSIAVSSRRVTVDRASFIRDVMFFLFVLCCLLLIVAFGQINLWFALCFASLYLVYIALVCLMQFLNCIEKKRDDVSAGVSVSPPGMDEFVGTGIGNGIGIPLLNCVDEESIPESIKQNRKEAQQSETVSDETTCSYRTTLILSVLELPLSLPRRLTIPDISEENWSKPFAVASATLSPILLAAVYTTQGQNRNLKSSLAIVLTSALAGTILGTLALMLTNRSSPPRKFVLPWLACTFIMSIAWTYITVEELVSLLVALGNIMGTDPSILGFTVLAWGNSMGDLISNLTMAVRGGNAGVQVAVSGCYAGPLFNTLVGLGLSLVFSAYPSGYVDIPSGGGGVYETVAFLMAGLLWAAVVLPKRGMRLDRWLGVGLLAIYFCFLFLRIVTSAGLVRIGG